MKIDPELQKQLAAAKDDDLVQAVLSLGPVRKHPSRSPAEVVAIAQHAIQKAKADSGETPVRFKVFGNMDSFAVEATPRFLRSLIGQDERLSAAVANRQRKPLIGKVGG